MRNKQNGLGTSMPPLKQHVIIYFSHKDVSEVEALKFFKYFTQRKWKTKRNKKVMNWKFVAWIWILNISLRHPQFENHE
jgi:hypothetical protein